MTNVAADKLRQTNSAADTRMSGVRAWLVVCAVALLLYAATANRGAQWQDSGVQQLRIVTGVIDNPHGLALTHPVQYWLGRLAIRLPEIAPAFAITLISSAAAAIAVANLSATIRLLTGSTPAAAISTAALALSHTFWQHATHTESYTLLAMFLTGEWLCLAAFAKSGKARFLLLTAFLNGLGLATHMLALLACPVNAAVFFWAARTQRCSRAAVGAGALLWLAGAAPYTGLAALRLFQTGDAVGVIHSAFFGEYAGDVLNVTVTLRDALLPFGYAAYNLPGLTIPLAVYGVFTALAKRADVRWLAMAYCAELLLYAAFVYRYSVPDQYSFFFPVYLLLAIFAGFGLARLTTIRGRLPRTLLALSALTAVWTPVVYVGTAAALRSAGVLKSMVGNKPYRDGYRSFFVPWGVGDNHADRLNEAVAALVGNDGIVLLPYNMIGVGVRYAKTVGQLPGSVGLRSVSPAGTSADMTQWRADLKRALDENRTVVMVPQDRDAPEGLFFGLSWARRGDLYVLDAIAASADSQRDPVVTDEQRGPHERP
jgi:hypothetical protein